jgi:hypothetical protein
MVHFRPQLCVELGHCIELTATGRTLLALCQGERACMLVCCVQKEGKGESGLPFPPISLPQHSSTVGAMFQLLGRSPSVGMLSTGSGRVPTQNARPTTARAHKFLSLSLSLSFSCARPSL